MSSPPHRSTPLRMSPCSTAQEARRVESLCLSESALRVCELQILARQWVTSPCGRAPDRRGGGGTREVARNPNSTVDRRLSSFRSTTQSHRRASRLPVPPSNICAGRSFAIFLLLSHSVSLYFSLIVAMQHWEQWSRRCIDSA